MKYQQIIRKLKIANIDGYAIGVKKIELNTTTGKIGGGGYKYTYKHGTSSPTGKNIPDFLGGTREGVDKTPYNLKNMQISSRITRWSVNGAIQEKKEVYTYKQSAKVNGALKSLHTLGSTPTTGTIVLLSIYETFTNPMGTTLSSIALDDISSDDCGLEIENANYGPSASQIVVL